MASKLERVGNYPTGNTERERKHIREERAVSSMQEPMKMVGQPSCSYSQSHS